MRLCIAAFILFLSSSASALAGPFANAHPGDWFGFGQETNGDTWRIALRFGNGSGVVNYPDFGCAAQWVYETDAPGRLTGRERLVEGAGVCADGLAIVVSDVKDGYIEVSWFDARGVEVAYAALAPSAAFQQ